MSNTEKNRRTSTNPDRFDRNAIKHLLRLAGPRPDVPAATGDRVRQATHAEWRQAVAGRQRRRTYLWAGLGLAAAATLAVVLIRPLSESPADLVPVVQVAELTSARGPVLRSSSEQPPQALPVGEAVFSGDILETGIDGRAALGLGADTSLRLDTSTRVRMLGGRRLSLEQGSIYVDSGDVAREVRAVEIVTDLGVVTDVGTQFLVRGNGAALDVRVREGEVRLSRGEEVHQVGVGTALMLTASGELSRRTTPIYGPEWDWILDVSPSFSLEGETLEAFLGWVSRETGWDLEFASETVAASLPVVLHGSVDGMRPNQALEAVLPTCGLTHRLAGGTLRIETETR